jgi:hypothetical protein
MSRNEKVIEQNNMVNDARSFYNITKGLKGVDTIEQPYPESKLVINADATVVPKYKADDSKPVKSIIGNKEGM